MILAGCSRTYYRDFADRQSYAIERARQLDRRWNMPPRPVEAQPGSRMADPTDPDHSPMPPDDPAARLFQVTNGMPFEFREWKKRGFMPLENVDWYGCLPRNTDGSVRLDRETVIDLSMKHSRDYQFEVEAVYLAALQLTLSQFQFQVQPFFNQSLFYQNAGEGANDSNQILPSTIAGFNQQFITGAQLMAQLSTNAIYEFNGAGFTTAASNLAITFTQPLMQGAWARNVTQPLSLAERGVLYTVRTFARFRRDFYVRVMGGGGYLGLLLRLQSIRNTEANLASLRTNLAEYDALLAAGSKSQTERDQVAQQVQQVEFQLINDIASLETALDSYKISLGLPPELHVELDDSPFEIFRLTDKRLDTLRALGNSQYIRLMQAQDETPVEEQRAVLKEVQTGFQTLAEVRKGVETELRRWQDKLGMFDAAGLPIALPDLPGESNQERENKAAERLTRTIRDTGLRLDDNLASLAKLEARMGVDPPGETWKALTRLVGREFRGRVSDYFVAQTQVRVYLIELTEVTLDDPEGIQLGLENRLDLMNTRAQVTDAWRNEEVAANLLQAGLTLNYTGTIATDPEFDDFFRFDSSAGIHRFGVTFDAPIVRRQERNAYRASQIAYQRARRAWMANRDLVVQQVRLNLRELRVQKRSFEIARESLIIAARQVDENEYNLRTSNQPDASYTLFLLQALQNQLGAQNTLISVWVGYETSRMSLYRDLDLMFLDASGRWINERENLSPAGSREPARPPASPATEAADMGEP